MKTQGAPQGAPIRRKRPSEAGSGGSFAPLSQEPTNPSWGLLAEA